MLRLINSRFCYLQQLFWSFKFFKFNQIYVNHINIMFLYSTQFILQEVTIFLWNASFKKMLKKRNSLHWYKGRQIQAFALCDRHKLKSISCLRIIFKNIDNQKTDMQFVNKFHLKIYFPISLCKNLNFSTTCILHGPHELQNIKRRLLCIYINIYVYLYCPLTTSKNIFNWKISILHSNTVLKFIKRHTFIWFISRGNY